MATVQNYLRGNLPEETYGKEEATNRLVGIEVELENVFYERQPKAWTLLEDGSLRNNGKEFTIPVYNNYALPYLEDLFFCLKTKESSSRCSVHIHVNILDFTLENIKTLILLYIIYEEALYEYSGKRWNSNYCVPVRTHLNTSLNNIRFDNLFNIFPKYSGLHFFPDLILGTVEFRHMAGNTNSDYINTWIQIVTSLVQTAKEMSYEALVEQLNNMYCDSSYWLLAKHTFGIQYNNINYKDFQKGAEHGVLLAKLLQQG